jgi:hypothetical protein
MNMLVTAAGAAASTAVVPTDVQTNDIAPRTSPGAASDVISIPDPILDLIGRHKAANEDLNAACSCLSDMEEAIPEHLREGGSQGFEVQTVDTDDPRWTAANIRYNDCALKVDAIAIEMLNIKPTTRVGLQAMLRYATQHVAEGYLWPDGAQIEDDEDQDGEPTLGGRNRDWSFYLMRNLSEAVPSIAG